MQTDDRGIRHNLVLMTGVLGVVYGDIGTSPLYALRECFHSPHAVEPTPGNILGILSLLFWSLILIVSVKYIGLVLRADNRGEGGILALLALALPERKRRSQRTAGYRGLVALGVFGAALLYGDGIVTPAISVLSAIEGTKYATPVFEPFIVPITVVVLIGLFSIQRIGTGAVGAAFGPIMLVWFFTLGLLGIWPVIQQPDVLRAISPWYAMAFFAHHGWQGFILLGSVVLVVTGCEALYADLGHFGKKPIRHAWFAVALPGLLLNYFGQGAKMLASPEASENPFYMLAPSWALIPLIVLATLATIIASQALISGVYSLTMQAIQLGYLPRLEIDHTSSTQRGQIYLPLVNLVLMLLCIGLVVGFRSSTNLAAAYGVAVTSTMIITTVLFFFAARRLWHWNWWILGAICLAFFMAEAAFLGANLLKIAKGGWVPLVVAGLLFVIMSTWKRGRQVLADRLRLTALPMDVFLEEVDTRPPLRVRGTAVYMSGRLDGVPIALLHNMKHNKVLHERVVLLTILNEETPHADGAQRVEVEKLAKGFFRITGRYGFMEEPNVPELLGLCAEKGMEFKMQDTTFFLSSETILASGKSPLASWRAKVFAFLARNAQRATAFFRLPANRVVELGMQVEL
jgi:KUP system potassium uptake protein